MKHQRLIWSGAVLVACIAMATFFFLGLGARIQTRATAVTACSLAAVVAAERGAQLLNPDGGGVAVPQGEPQIVATVNGQTITAARLEMMVQNTAYTDQTTLASLGAGVPPPLLAKLTRSPATLRQMLLTQLIDDDLWLTQGQHDGEYASIAATQSLLQQSLALSHSASVSSPARTQFAAFLCVNHLTEASYLADPRVVQSVRNALTIAAAKKHMQSTLALSQQHDLAAVTAAENAYVQSLWTKNSVKIFLTGFVPLRM